MGKSLQKALLVSLVAFAGGVQGAMAESKARSQDEMCTLRCSDMFASLVAQATSTANPNSKPRSVADAMKNLKDFSSSCFNLCMDGFITIEALSNAAGFSSNSYTSAPAPMASPAPSPAPRPSAPTTGRVTRHFVK